MSEKNDERGHSFEDYFKRAVNPMVILTLLCERPKYAYEMTQELKEKTGGGYQMPLLYPVLYRLQSQGYIEQAEKIISVDNRIRNYYRITDAGIKHLSKLKVEYLKLCSYMNKLIDFSDDSAHP